MMITLKKPIYHGGSVRLTGTNIEVGEQHGRTLIKKGYASAPQASQSDSAKAASEQEAAAKKAADGAVKAGAEKATKPTAKK